MLYFSVWHVQHSGRYDPLPLQQYFDISLSILLIMISRCEAGVVIETCKDWNTYSPSPSTILKQQSFLSVAAPRFSVRKPSPKVVHPRSKFGFVSEWWQGLAP